MQAQDLQVYFPKGTWSQASSESLVTGMLNDEYGDGDLRRN